MVWWWPMRGRALPRTAWFVAALAAVAVIILRSSTAPAAVGSFRWTASGSATGPARRATSTPPETRSSPTAGSTRRPTTSSSSRTRRERSGTRRSPAPPPRPSRPRRTATASSRPTPSRPARRGSSRSTSTRTPAARGPASKTVTKNFYVAKVPELRLLRHRGGHLLPLPARRRRLQRLREPEELQWPP